MRILVISPTPSHPQDAGNRARIHAVLSALKAAGHQIHLCLLLREGMPPSALDAMRAAWDEVVTVPHDRRAERPGLGEVFGLDDWVQPAAEAAWAELAARHPGFDMVIVQYVFLSKALLHFPDAIRVIDTHDVLGGRADRLRAAGLQPSFFYTTEREEARGLARADAVLAIQEEERAELEARSLAPVLTLGHIPGPRPALPAATPGRRFAIGYIGSANPMNVRALRRFLDALDTPALVAAGAEMVVAGGAAQPLAPAAGLRLLGAVADPDELYAQVDLVVNPHEGGTGLKIKTVEALARGCPVIGTAEAFAGLSPQATFQSAPDAPALAPAAWRALRDPGFRAKVSAASAALWRGYAAQVERQLSVVASPAALRLAVDRPRVLLLTDIPFWREELGNHARIAALARAARGEMDLDLLMLGALEPADRLAAQRVLGPRGRVFATGPLQGLPPGPLPRELAPFERRRASAGALARVAAHLAEHPVEGAIIQYIRLSWLRHAPGMPAARAIDIHDLMSLRAQNFAHFGREHFIQIGTQEELDILSAFPLVLAIQAEEWRWLDRLLPGQVVLAPHPVPVARPALGTWPEGPVRVGFLGGDSPMNRDGLLWMLDQVWPAVAPLGAELHVAGEVGACVPPGRAGVVVRGRVDDPAAFLAGLDVAVNPVFYGGGLKIKTVEYLCHGLPCVLTAEALTGLSGPPGEAWMLARSRGEFVAALSALVLDSSARARVGEAAFAFGRRHFGPGALAPAVRAIAGLARGGLDTGGRLLAERSALR
ncbi:MAG TPA: glycosyltransferase [Acetobacteraceae bacterium]|nr:glycosyltransferase [Acetobacteraceae bacterium]